ncbi:hypothetical protein CAUPRSCDRAFT_13038 [Caulochytrium protostelioides]|uniref:Uncharacterized protein n=1 Tax=Caulochytrium protostelioides TaxID=1555241 RepID=A0A4V1ISZ2_9FUNG|nr:hypothetical protein CAUPRSCDRAFT_13038 [Caulochytrium protostelioides]
MEAVSQAASERTFDSLHAAWTAATTVPPLSHALLTDSEVASAKWLYTHEVGLEPRVDYARDRDRHRVSVRDRQHDLDRLARHRADAAAADVADSHRDDAQSDGIAAACGALDVYDHHDADDTSDPRVPALGRIRRCSRHFYLDLHHVQYDAPRVRV